MKRRGLKDRKFWIGLTDRESHGEWIFETSRLKPSYLNWAPKVMIAHLELCQDNSPLNLLAINCNHLVSKNNCNYSVLIGLSTSAFSKYTNIKHTGSSELLLVGAPPHFGFQLVGTRLFLQI